MNMYDLFSQAVGDARAVRFQAERWADSLAGVLLDIGLRHVSTHKLRMMKRRLQRFNSTTGEWND